MSPPVNSADMLISSQATTEFINNNHNNNNNDDDVDDLCEKPALTTEELALLAKLEEANRLIESDSKSLNSISNNSTHSRKSSDASQISLVSGTGSSQDGEEDVWGLWGQVVNDWEGYNKKKNAYLKELVRKGVPHHFRGIVWQFLCGANDSPIRKQYPEYIKATSACEKVIRRDIARTYPEHDFFKEKDGLGQESLFNVMKAYSLHDREVGYCQGSGFIVGLLLMQMPEEEAFAVFVKIMQDYKMRDMFKPTMAELGLCMYQLEHLVQDHIPELFVHFQSQSFHTTMYASSWFLTLFTTALALPTACRIIDVFLSEGIEIIFKVALALLQLGKDDLLCLDMEGMLRFFQKELPSRANSDADGLMAQAFNIKYNVKRMKKLEKEYTAFKSKEQEEMVELKKLRTENRLLRQKVELLEAESSELAGLLVRGQVSRAEEEETTFIVQRELTALRHTHLETSHALENALEEIKQMSILITENHNSCQSSLDELSIKQEQLSLKEEMISDLQEELVKVRLRDAENEAAIRDLKDKIGELEHDKKTLRESVVDNSVAHLQEELIAVKLREAEANLSLKDLRQRVNEINSQWQRHLLDKKRIDPPPAPDSTPKKIGNLLNWNNAETQRLEEELMTSKLREMETLAELKELRLKVMELETQVQVSGNQLRRQDDDNKAVREQLELAETKQRDIVAKLREQQNKYTDLESKMKHDMISSRIREAEHAQMVAELNQKISRLEVKNEEMVTEGELRNNSLDDSDKVKELQDKVADLKAEVMRLEAWKQRWVNNGNTIGKTERSASVDTTESEMDDSADLHLQLSS
ncbi:ecotropic viral integration site 5 ortholog isoform X1 [Aphis gossypii]|uniref:ecotropic viral integration site 5 ortholog isoform X1 n=1 Tax=Aphis gossypii TaxID=80765 RepID=UPI0021598AA6|nr:ecotropic viral integration site 5 ortholog isoform X1 [Aphis gossypii]XP_027849807.2 ecotropic viral integration site 5 ortholog isoform X1 [Aphis gossypii]XP_050054549.1 ecotropic viral integration site 5 ortholog isoform X1 [Aphis gossypii]